MKLVYTHYNSMLVGLVRGKLELEGFAVEVRNDLAAGGAGELAPMDLWQELWVDERQDIARAQAVIETITHGAESADWQCSLCGEKNAGTFEVCWRCRGIPPRHFD